MTIAVAQATTPDIAEVLAELAADAEYFQPRLFAVYGVYRGRATTSHRRRSSAGASN